MHCNYLVFPQGRCTKLFCPIDQYPFNGRCIPIRYKTEGYAVNIPFRIRTSNNLTENGLKQAYERLFMPGIRSLLKGCAYCRSMVALSGAGYTMYGRVTRPCFYNKHSPSTVNKALDQLSQTFKEKYVNIESGRISISAAVTDFNHRPQSSYQVQGTTQ